MLRSNLACNIESLIPSMLFSDSGLRRRQWRSGNLIDFIKSIFWSNYSLFDQANFKSILFGKLPIQILILIQNVHVLTVLLIPWQLDVDFKNNWSKCNLKFRPALILNVKLCEAFGILWECPKPTYTKLIISLNQTVLTLKVIWQKELF